jgi:hypothetical protein
MYRITRNPHTPLFLVNIHINKSIVTRNERKNPYWFMERTKNKNNSCLSVRLYLNFRHFTLQLINNVLYTVQ